MAISGDSFDCHNSREGGEGVGAPDIQGVEARNAAKHPTMAFLVTASSMGETPLLQ